MKKIGMVLAMVLLTGCAEQTFIYNGKEMTKTEIEERIADTLEVENPEYDLDISISNDVD